MNCTTFGSTPRIASGHMAAAARSISLFDSGAMLLPFRKGENYAQSDGVGLVSSTGHYGAGLTF